MRIEEPRGRARAAIAASATARRPSACAPSRRWARRGRRSRASPATSSERCAAKVEDADTLRLEVELNSGPPAPLAEVEAEPLREESRRCAPRPDAEALGEELEEVACARRECEDRRRSPTRHAKRLEDLEDADPLRQMLGRVWSYAKKNERQAESQALRESRGRGQDHRRLSATPMSRLRRSAEAIANALLRFVSHPGSCQAKRASRPSARQRRAVVEPILDPRRLAGRRHAAEVMVCRGELACAGARGSVRAALDQHLHGAPTKRCARSGRTPPGTVSTRPVHACVDTAGSVSSSSAASAPAGRGMTCRPSRGRTGSTTSIVSS